MLPAVTGNAEGFRPDWLSPPGGTIAETIRGLGISRSEAARRMGVSPPFVTALVQSRKGIGPTTALRLEGLTGVSAEFWARLWAGYAVGVERRRREQAACRHRWERTLVGMPWPARCRYCALRTTDPDAWFYPPGWDEAMVPEDRRCPASPSGAHEPDETVRCRRCDAVRGAAGPPDVAGGAERG